jgi:hypothetical protein
MKVEINITVSADDGSSPKSATSALLLATELEGVDAATAKQDFITQAEGLVRTISESQLPALYQASLDAQAQAAKQETERDRGVPDSVRAKLSKLRQRKGQEAGQAAANADQGPGVDVVECTDCGAKLESDMAHYIAVVKDGKFQRNAVLCDACYGKLLAANDGGTRPETAETGENGENSETSEGGENGEAAE